MKRKRATATLFCDPILQTKRHADLTTWVEDHVPGQFGYFGRAKTGLNREKNDQTVAEWMPRAFGEKHEIVDMISRKRLGLFTWHVAQIVACRF
jgi:hypothetical protein